MSTKEKVILLIGYGWFAGIPRGETNNAEQIARALDGERIAAGNGACGRVHALIVPVAWERAFPPVEEAIRKLCPDIVLALGTDGRASAMRPEPCGVNRCKGMDADPDDPDRRQMRDGVIEEGGEDAEWGSLPFEAMVRAMLSEGIPAQLGSVTEAAEDEYCKKACTTGAYLCNYMAYRLAAYAKANAPGMRVGFMHVPTQPQYAAAQRIRAMEQGEDLTREMQPSLPLEMMICGTRAALRACIQTE